MTTLLLVRHGQSEANRLKTFAGNTDVPLDEKGILQANKTGEFIKENYKIDSVYASDLKRAFLTGEIISEHSGVEIKKEKLLREIFAGEWEGKSFDTLTTEFSSDYSVWLSDIGKSKCTNGESVKELSERILRALSSIAEENDGKTVVIATHATPIRSMMCILNGLSLDEMKNVGWVSNASVTELFYDNGKWSFGKTGQDAHLSELRSTFPKNV